MRLFKLTENGKTTWINHDTGSIFTLNQIMNLIKECASKPEKLSTWETGFIGDLALKMWGHKEITEPQLKKLESIYVRVT